MVQPTVAYSRATGDAAGNFSGNGSPQHLHIEVVALRTAPVGPAVDLVAVAISSDEGSPFRGASPLHLGSRWLHGPSAAVWMAQRNQLGPDQLQTLGSTDAGLAAGVITTCQPGLPTLPELVLVPQPAAAGTTTFVQLRWRLANGSHHIVHIAEALATSASVLFVPTAAGGRDGHAVVLHPIAQATAATTEAMAIALAAADARPAFADWPPAWQQAFAAVGQHNRRPALLALAQPLLATRCIDVLLIADERALIAVTQTLASVQPMAADVSWQFERALWLALLPRQQRDELTPALRAAVGRHLGALANDATALQFTLTVANSTAAFLTAVHAANVAALADRHPADRVRAHDWLRANGGSVRDYDPLADRSERRAALRQHATTAASQGPDRQ